MPDTCPDKPVDEASQKALARIWFDKGDKLAEEEKYVDSLGAYNCSLRMIEHPATKFNAAQAAHLAGQSALAIEILEDVLKKTNDQQTAKEAVEFIQTINEERSDKVPEPAKPVETADSASEEPLEDQPELEPEPIHEIVPAPRLAPEPGSKTGPEWLRTVGYVAVGASGAALVTGSVLQILAGSAKKTTGDTVDYDEYEEAKSSLDRYQLGATVSFIAGGVILGAGVAMLWLDSDKGENSANVSVAPTPRGVLVRYGF
jgi:hypothetical protein